MDNGWWVSTRREEDARRHVDLLRRRQQDYFTRRFVRIMLVWMLVTGGLAAVVRLLSLPGEVAFGGSMVALAAIATIARTRFPE